MPKSITCCDNSQAAAIPVAASFLAPEKTSSCPRPVGVVSWTEIYETVPQKGSALTRNRSTLTLAVAVLAVALFTNSCTNYPSNVAQVLKDAGDNRAELEQVLEHYRNGDDSLKYEAALYLIGNMGNHSFVTYYMHDTTDTELPFNVLDYPDYDSLVKAVEVLQDEHGELDFGRHDPVYDYSTITADFLTTQIDYAFRAWRERPWARALSWEDFRDYVLPYRGSNEPLEEWRVELFDKYATLPDEVTDSTDPVEAAALINRDIMTWFGFDPRFYYHPTDQGLLEMRTNGLGRCEDMTNVTIYAMRANGIGVTSDYTPYWANTGNNHAWNAIVLPSGEVIPFMGAESNPGEYHLANNFAKVYRKTFNEQSQNLAFIEHKQEKIPGWLAGKYYRDVTEAYASTCDVEVVFEEQVPDSVDLAYLCVFNSGEWKPIQWSKLANQTAVFKAMVPGILYLPALYLNEEIAPFGDPFILEDGCIQKLLTVAADEPAEMTLVSTTRRKQVESTDGIATSYLTEGTQYELQYWDDEWKTIDTLTAGRKPLEFTGVPAGGLYWLTEIDSNREERPFTYDQGHQVWW